MPVPLSFTCKRTIVLGLSTVTTTTPPAGVCLQAFVNKLATICASLCLSPLIQTAHRLGDFFDNLMQFHFFTTSRPY
ncbi:hypothetical protein FB479_103556 [Brevibacillus sp. AG162]|uniref:hypothetical protein n=1 Tax=Brevibacillus sp. AG162 TaxID=2572910 RepID=UPI0011742B30|nr:hypothetical protein [Brevibacillus sp. AG162]TQK63686.1 hypothetical protein FB479_103556 [Brevibacillus sp. AG162]